jgi:hypothetical protein
MSRSWAAGLTRAAAARLAPAASLRSISQGSTCTDVHTTKSAATAATSSQVKKRHPDPLSPLHPHGGSTSGGWRAGRRKRHGPGSEGGRAWSRFQAAGRGRKAQLSRGGSGFRKTVRIVTVGNMHAPSLPLSFDLCCWFFCC